MTPMASRSRRELPTLTRPVSFRTRVNGASALRKEISTAASNAAKRASWRPESSLAVSSSVELSTPNATWQMLSKANRRSASCRSTASPDAAAASRNGRSPPRRCTARTSSEKRRSAREEKA
ncbi:Os05g0382400 [Oryza sativa Japonica Group]|uniref:Os05g0382400 protein n=2 Tax=Oryza sativa subsp. japonica TaxID=39947 RepID=Q0DIK3_ORYSJ|nr:hypothetical protein EE612_029170 [Oryza sativa]BAF17320.1 Os05g0382400 [Oryza sativa Japonica Group]BAS93779.1 Os05g0382400 [Oryza sativa Japonica Group]|eukprot:NP_001055406.1 Os05g0382400 [Oryza sativa Japonica Group]